MSTQFYGVAAPGSELRAQLDEAVASAAAPRADGLRTAVSSVQFGGIKLQYDLDRGQWFFYTADFTPTPPARLAELDNVFHVTHAQVDKNYGVVDEKAAHQGDYTGRGRFHGCTATVDNRSVEPRQEIKVFGPLETFYEFYSAVRSRKVLPDVWLEPEPGLVVRILRALRLISR